MITIVDQCLGTKLSLSVAGSANVTLSTAQSQNLYFNFTGALTGNIQVIFPASAGRIIVVNNATSGAFTLTVIPSGGTGFLVTQGSQQLILIDGTANVAQAVDNNILPLEVTLASATTTDLGATGTNVVAISGTTTITSLGSSATTTECLYFVRFTGALTLTYNGTSLILPGVANITTAAGDTALFKYEGSGHWRCLFYTVAAGLGSSGTVNAGTANQLAYYASSTNAVNGTTAIPNGTTATTQTAADSSTKVATTAFVNGTALTLATGTTAITQGAADSSTKVATTAFVNNTALTLKTGTTAVTQAASDSSTKVATTAFANPGSSIATSGYQILASGLYLQWGQSNTSGSATTTIAFPIAFPTNVFEVVTSALNSGSNGIWISIQSFTTSQVVVDSFNASGRVATTATYFAIGN